LNSSGLRPALDSQYPVSAFLKKKAQGTLELPAPPRIPGSTANYNGLSTRRARGGTLPGSFLPIIDAQPPQIPPVLHLKAWCLR